MALRRIGSRFHLARLLLIVASATLAALLLTVLPRFGGASRAGPRVRPVQNVRLSGTSLEHSDNAVTITTVPTDCLAGCSISVNLLPDLRLRCQAEDAPCTATLSVATVFGCQRELTVTPMLDGNPAGPAITVACPASGEQPIAYTWIVDGLTRGSHSTNIKGTSLIHCNPNIQACETVDVLNTNLIVNVYAQDQRPDGH